MNDLGVHICFRFELSTKDTILKLSLIWFATLWCWLIVICILPRVSLHISLFVFLFGVNYPFDIYLLQDIDTYKNSAKDEIMDWMNTLKKCGTAHDWMVVLVETPESRKGANKLLPRTSVVDRLRTDVGTKFSDRCLTLTGENYICTRAVGRS